MTPYERYEVSFRFRRILVPVDGSESSLRALDVAVDFAKHYGSTITVLHVSYAGTRKAVDAVVMARKRLENQEVRVEYKDVKVDPAFRSVASAIVEEARDGYDLVILGARGLSLTPDLNVGSVVLSVVANVDVSVFIVR
ncbi:MAG: universal stress protein [Desulfurococcales archaeon]|nr:universal stress protein [Desulfurococcales archaeon]